MPDSPAVPGAVRLIFLHIPKTAGQSVHHFLVRLVDRGDLAPARVNEQLVQLSIPDLRRYRLFAGHLDWSLLDCVPAPKFVFTVLREPLSRIVSFYLYLRREAEQLAPGELDLPHRQGMKAIMQLSCHEYFTAGPAHIRNFIDNHYHNFYAFYFAGRYFDARQRLIGQQRADPAFTNQKILQIALANLATLDGIYTIDRLDRLERDLARITGKAPPPGELDRLRVNKGDGDALAARLEKLRKYGATDRTFERLREMTELDQEIWQYAASIQFADT